MKLHAITIATIALMLVGCSTPAAETPSPTPSPSATRSVTTTPTRTPTPTPTPTWTPVAAAPTATRPPVYAGPTYEEEIFLAAMGTVDPGLNHERSLGRAKNMCMDIAAGMDEAGLLLRLEARFEGGTVAVLSERQRTLALNLIRTTCV